MERAKVGGVDGKEIGTLILIPSETDKMGIGTNSWEGKKVGNEDSRGIEH
jgi:hypothetical protein